MAEQEFETVESLAAIFHPEKEEDESIKIED